MEKVNCEECYCFRVCPQKPKREDYTDENKYLIDLECGVWSCHRTAETLFKENEELKRKLSEISECFISTSENDDFEMAEAGREVRELIGFPMKHPEYGEKSKLFKANEIIKHLLWDLRNRTFNPEKDIEQAEIFLGRRDL